MLMKDNIAMDGATEKNTESPFSILDEATLVEGFLLLTRRMADDTSDPTSWHGEIDRLEAYWAGMRGLPIEVP